MESQLRLIIADLEDYTRGEVIALALNVNANLRSSPPLGTPIDTGWASANWVPNVGEPFIDASAAMVREPTPAKVSARAKDSAQGESNVLAWDFDQGPIFSSNNVPYIGALNNGHSSQSPRGFVQIAIEKAIRQTYSRARSFAARAGRAAEYRNSKPRPVK